MSARPPATPKAQAYYVAAPEKPIPDIQVWSEISHAFQTPLTILKSALELLAEQQLMEQKHVLTTMQQSVDDLSHLTRNLLQLAKMEVEPEQLREDMIDLSELITNLTEYVAVICKHHKITLTVSTISSAHIFGTKELITEMITNLLSNAVKYTKPCTIRKIAVTLSSAEGSYLLTIADTGVGIPPNRIDHIFQRFYREHRQGTTGAGLGLAIVKRIIELHRGTIRVESSVGKGTCMILTIPAYTSGSSNVTSYTATRE